MNSRTNTVTILCAWLGAALLLFSPIPDATAGNVSVAGNLSVVSNLTASSVTVGGETRTNWPSGGGGSGAVDLTTATLDFSQPGQFYRFTITNATTWVFTNHVAGQQVSLQIKEDSTGGWTNAWPTGLLWPGGSSTSGSLSPLHVNTFKILDDGTYWYVQSSGLDYHIPCASNCNYALQFDANQNYVDVPYNSALFPATFTIECWFKNHAQPSNASTMLSTYNGNSGGFYCGFSATWHVLFFQLGTSDGGFTLNSSDTGVFDGNWHHMATTYDGTNLTTYIDGTVGDSMAATGIPSDNGGGDFDIGSGDGFENYNGAVDEVRISSKVRYTGTFTPAQSFTTDSDTVGYWKFNENGGTTAHDETGNHNGSLQGSPAPLWIEGQ